MTPIAAFWCGMFLGALTLAVSFFTWTSISVMPIIAKAKAKQDAKRERRRAREHEDQSTCYAFEPVSGGVCGRIAQWKVKAGRFEGMPVCRACFEDSEKRERERTSDLTPPT